MKSLLFKTSIGSVAIAWNHNAVVALQLPGKTRVETEKMLIAKVGGVRFVTDNKMVPAWVSSLIKNITAHLANGTGDFSKVRIDLASQSQFCRKIYRTLQKTVKSGTTITYGELAIKCGYPKAARGVGQALKKNPVPLLIPCHRVIGANKKPGGFSAPGGINRKILLLKIERHQKTSNLLLPSNR